MTVICQFVDSIAASPTVNLDLNSGVKFKLVDKPEISPPTLRRSGAESMLVDGAQISATAYNNRTVTLRVSIPQGVTQANAGAYISDLAAELNKSENILKIQIGSIPVFLRTFRSDYTIELNKMLMNTARAEFELECEPFAYGLRQTLANWTPGTDPATSSPAMYVDLTPTDGDVPSPAYIQATGVAGKSTLLSVRRHGNPTNGVFYRQMETFDLGTGSAVVSDSAASNGQALSSVLNSSLTQSRAGGYIPATSLSTVQAKEFRGRYRMYARAKWVPPDASITQVGVATGVQVRAKLAGWSLNPTVQVAYQSGYQLIDLGSVSIPVGNEGQRAGFGVAAGTQPVLLQIYASGAGSMYFDYVLLLPEDEELTQVDWPTAPIGSSYYFTYDGPNDETYWQLKSDETVLSAASQGFPARLGRMPLITPNQTNRLWFVYKGEVPSSTGTVAAAQEAISLRIHYWPCYLNIFPGNESETPPPVGTTTGYGRGRYGRGAYGTGEPS